MLINTEGLHVVRMVALHGSFSAAAEKLNRVPSAISYTVRKLEQNLDVKLFERDGKYLKLTPAGQFFLERAKAILGELEDLHISTAHFKQGIEPSLRITLNDIVNTAPIGALVQAFQQQFSSTELKVSIDVYNGVWDALYNNRADIAIGAPGQVLPGGGMAWREMGVVKWIFVVAPTHPLATAPEPIPYSALHAHTVIGVEDTSQIFAPKIAWRLQGQKVLFVPNIQCKLDAHLRGLGIGVLPQHMCQGHLDRGELVVKEISEPKQDTPLLVAWPNGRTGRCLQWCVDYLSDASVKKSWTAQ